MYGQIFQCMRVGSIKTKHIYMFMYLYIHSEATDREEGKKLKSNNEKKKNERVHNVYASNIIIRYPPCN